MEPSGKSHAIELSLMEPSGKSHAIELSLMEPSGKSHAIELSLMEPSGKSHAIELSFFQLVRFVLDMTLNFPGQLTPAKVVFSGPWLGCWVERNTVC